MRICLIADTRSVHVQSRMLPLTRRGHDIQAISERPSGVAGWEEACPPKGPYDGWMRWLNEAVRMINFWRLVRSCPGDLVQIHYACSLGAWMYLITGRKEPLVVTTMGGDILFDEQSDLPRTARWMTRQVLKRADMITARTDHMANVLEDLDVRPDKVFKLIWGVDLSLFKPGLDSGLKSTLGIQKGQNVLFSPRLLRPLYNIDEIIRSLPEILSRHPETILLQGEYECDPAYREDIVALAESLGVSKAVKLVGAIPYASMPDYYNIADVVVSIPQSDGFPQSILEAWACAAPLVVSNLDRYRELAVEDKNAVFVAPNAADVAGGVIRVLEDQAFSQNLSREGLSTARQHGDLAQNLTRLETQYEAVLRNAPSPPASLGVRMWCAFVLAAQAIRRGIREA